MGFFKDFKSDLSQAVNELVADEELKKMTEKEKDKEKEKEVKEKLPKVEGDVVEPDSDEDMELLKQLIAEDDVKEPVDVDETVIEDSGVADLEETISADEVENDLTDASDEDESVDSEDNVPDEEQTDDIEEDVETDVAEESEEKVETDVVSDTLDKLTATNEEETDEKEEKVQEQEAENEATKDALRGKRNIMEKNEIAAGNTNTQEAVADEVTEITKGTAVDGNIIAEGSMNVYGKIKGNVACRGKLVICGTVVGASRAAEVYTNNAKVDGDVTSDGSIKVGSGSIIIGNVYGTSAVIAGAVKGDIDVHGPVIVDGTAVVQGNIRSRSVQINNGAAIEGSVSQCYAEIDYAALFDKTFAK